MLVALLQLFDTGFILDGLAVAGEGNQGGVWVRCQVLQVDLVLLWSLSLPEAEHVEAEGTEDSAELAVLA